VNATIVKRSLLGAAALGSAVGLLGTGTPAQAVVPPGQIVIAAAGSDTTDDVMNAILTGTNQKNIRATPASAQFIEGDVNCTDLTYNKAPVPVGQVLSPNGSSNGRNALAQSATNPAGTGCIDIARSSAGPRAISANEPASFEYYAFAMDAMGWASTSLAAPGTMTKQQFKDIYNCVITDWSQLPGGGSGPIQRYIPQTGSGTYGFFLSDLMDGVAVAGGTAQCPTRSSSRRTRAWASSPPTTRRRSTVLSTGQWTYRPTTPSTPPSTSAEARMGGWVALSTVNANTARWNGLDGLGAQHRHDRGQACQREQHQVEQPDAGLPAIRYVYNVVNSVHVNYAEARASSASATSTAARSRRCAATASSARSSASASTAELVHEHQRQQQRRRHLPEVLADLMTSEQGGAVQRAPHRSPPGCAPCAGPGVLPSLIEPPLFGDLTRRHRSRWGDLGLPLQPARAPARFQEAGPIGTPAPPNEPASKEQACVQDPSPPPHPSGGPGWHGVSSSGVGGLPAARRSRDRQSRRHRHRQSDDRPRQRPDCVHVHVDAVPPGNPSAARSSACRPGSASPAVIDFAADFNPTQTGNCVLNPLSPGTDTITTVATAPPGQSADLNFVVGTGTDNYVDQTEQRVDHL
jgi:ABC-type phosphate transport system substrate-binding protein